MTVECPVCRETRKTAQGLAGHLRLMRDPPHVQYRVLTKAAKALNAKVEAQARGAQAPPASKPAPAPRVEPDRPPARESIHAPEDPRARRVDSAPAPEPRKNPTQPARREDTGGLRAWLRDSRSPKKPAREPQDDAPPGQGDYESRGSPGADYYAALEGKGPLAARKEAGSWDPWRPAPPDEPRKRKRGPRL